MLAAFMLPHTDLKVCGLNLHIVCAAGFEVLRFAWWQRIWGDARNAQMNRALPERATPASQTYLGKDGISWQDMVTLANQVMH
jgi:hypothetical protein